MDDFIAAHNRCANLIRETEKEYYLKIENLILDIKKNDVLFWRRFSQDLGMIKLEYDTKIYKIGYNYIIDTKIEPNPDNIERVFDDVTEVIKKFKNFCDDTFDKIYNEYDKTKGLIGSLQLFFAKNEAEY